jgi:hypothetical protein
MRTMSMDEYWAERQKHAGRPDPDRKALVIAELGYDPAKPRRERPCFTPPLPEVDISDFPDGITNPWA